MNKNKNFNYDYQTGKSARLTLLKLIDARLKGLPVGADAVERAERAVRG